MPRKIDHIRPFSTPFYDDDDKRVDTLLCGDSVRPLGERVIDGLVNIRTDGNDFDIQTFLAGVEAPDEGAA